MRRSSILPLVWLLADVPLSAATPSLSDRSVELLRYGCKNDLGRREVTLFANGTVRLRDGNPGVEGEDWMGLAELDPDQLEGAINRLQEEDLSEIFRLPSGVEGSWVERCTLSLELPGRGIRVFHFGRYDALPLQLSRVIRVAEDVAAEVKDIRGREELPADYEPRPMDILKRRDGQTFRVLGFTSDKLGVELEGVDVPLTVYVPKADMKREFVALLERRGGLKK